MTEAADKPILPSYRRIIKVEAGEDGATTYNSDQHSNDLLATRIEEKKLVINPQMTAVNGTARFLKELRCNCPFHRFPKTEPPS